MTKSTLTVLVLACVLFAMPAMAQNIKTGNDMVRHFQACDTAARLMESLKATNNLRSFDAIQDQRLDAEVDCWEVRGFVTGVTYAAAYFDGLLITGRQIDIPDDISYGQVVTVVRHYLDNHPESLNQPAAALTIKALTEAWPRGKKK